MREYTKRPNPDAFTTVSTTEVLDWDRYRMDLELWERDNESVWVLVISDSEVNQTNIPIRDSDVGLILRMFQ